MVLTIAAADVKRLCSIPGADTSQDDDITALISAEQPPAEYALDPAVLAAAPPIAGDPFAGNPGLLATLTLGIAEMLAGSYLEQVVRQVGYTDDFEIGGLHITASKSDGLPQLAARLVARGHKRIEPFLRASRRLALDAVGGNPDGSTRVDGVAGGPILASVFSPGAGPASVFDGSFDAGRQGEGGSFG